MTATPKPAPIFALPATLDLQAAAPLRESLLAHQGQSLTLDGEAVRRLGGQCLQVLLAARRSWEADGCDFRIEPISPAFGAALHAFGLTPDSFNFEKDSAA